MKLMNCIFLAGVLGLASLLPAQAVRDQHVEAELVPEVSAIVPGEAFTVALRLNHDPKWHTYWENPQTGYQTSLDWDLPDGFEAGEIQWPTPMLYQQDFILDFVYEGVTYLPVTLTAPEDLEPGSTVTFDVVAEWLMCADICIPGEVELSLTLPVAAESEPHPQWGEEIAATLAKMPRAPENWELKAWESAEAVILELTSEKVAVGELPEGLQFFTLDNLITPAKSHPMTRTGENGFQLELAKSDGTDVFTGELKGVLRNPEGWVLEGGIPGMLIDVETVEGLPPVLGEVVATTAPFSFGTLMIWMGSAFLGGLILNLMPCVFPVIGIKIFGFVNQAGQSRGKVILHGLTFAAGVILSFWVLAGLLLVLRAGGEGLGWGFQMQYPGFVFAIAIVFLLFALNLSGVFEIGGSLVGVGSNLTQKEGLGGSFFSGILATIVATPCSAPFLGTALGAALSASAFEAILVFTAIGVGLSFPYLFLSSFPALVKHLPRPGAWMETFKQFMAFPLYATVGLLLWILSRQVTEEAYGQYGFLLVFFALTMVGVAAWVFGRWAAPHRKSGTRRMALAATVALLVGGALLGLPRAVDQSAPTYIAWEKWSDETVEGYLEAGNVVYVDFTAAWCATCQTNKAAVFSSDEVNLFINENGIVTLKADWTNRDDEITEALARYGKAAVPFNLIYVPGREPIFLPEVLTPGIVLEALKDAVRAGEGVPSIAKK